MRVIGSGSTPLAREMPHSAQTAETTAASSATTALVGVAPIAPRKPISSSQRPDAPFLTQLIATAERMAATRTLRRASEADAEAAYRSVATKRPGSAGLRVSRNI
jgi:hypothetical protein